MQKPDAHVASTNDVGSTDIAPLNGALRVWWMPQIPHKPFYAPVATPAEAKKFIALLSDYDRFQFDEGSKPDYYNVGGLEVYEFDGITGVWCEWFNDDGETIT